MPFDPTKPVENSPLDAAEMRNQLNALKDLIDAQQAQIADHETRLNEDELNIGDMLNSLNLLQTAFDNYVASHP